MSMNDFTAIIDKTEELCALLVQQPAYEELRQMVENFNADEQAIKQYEQFLNIQQAQQQVQQQTPEEIARFNLTERAIYDNATIRKYLYAQKELDYLQQQLTHYISKTIMQGWPPKSPVWKKMHHGCGSHKNV